MMSWQAYRLVFRLESPLHIGWRKPGNLMQTRYYVPGRVFWGAATASLTGWLGSTNYRQVGDWVRNNLRFGYFFPANDPDNPLYPIYNQGNISYGRDRSLTEAAFERRFLSSLASTAIAAEVFASQEGSLHEVEFIIPALDTGKPVYLVGHLFVRTQTDNGDSVADDKMVMTIENDDIKVQGYPLCHEILTSLRIGGERHYGFGRLTLCQGKRRPVNDLFEYELDEENLHVTVPAQEALLAHTIASSMNVTGSIEPLASREWVREQGPGRRVALLGLGYLPGSVVTTGTTFAIGRYGIWEQVV